MMVGVLCLCKTAVHFYIIPTDVYDKDFTLDAAVHVSPVVEGNFSTCFRQFGSPSLLQGKRESRYFLDLFCVQCSACGKH